MSKRAVVDAPVKPGKIELKPGVASHVLTAAGTGAEEQLATVAGATVSTGSKWNNTGRPLVEALGLSDPAAPANIVTLVPKTALEFSWESCVPGAFVKVPLALIDLNDYGPRQIYSNLEVGKIEETFAKGQDDAAHGYVEAGRVKLIDGGTRFAAAKNTGAAVLEVKIEVAPADNLNLYLRARELNDRRSQPSALNFALGLQKLMTGNAVTSQRELAQKVPGPDGDDMSEVTVSKYLRIAKLLPEKIQHLMAEKEVTSSYGVLWEISELFADNPTDELLIERTAIAKELILDFSNKPFSREKLARIVQAKLHGPVTRERSNVHQLDMNGHKGYIKVFAKKGKLDLSLQGVSAEKLPKLRDALEATLKEFLQT